MRLGIIPAWLDLGCHMEKVFHSSFSKAILSSPKAPYILALAFMVLGLFETWRLCSLHAELMTAHEIIRTRDWQVTEEAERRSLADLRVSFLQNKDAAYASSQIVMTWFGKLHQGLVSVQGLPAPPSGRAYQLWVLDPGALAPVNAGLLKSTPSSQVVAVHPVTTNQVGFAVTLEPVGGSPEPTSSILFAVAPGQ